MEGEDGGYGRGKGKETSEETGEEGGRMQEVLDRRRTQKNRKGERGGEVREGAVEVEEGFAVPFLTTLWQYWSTVTGSPDGGVSVCAPCCSEESGPTKPSGLRQPAPPRAAASRELQPQQAPPGSRLCPILRSRLVSGVRLRVRLSFLCETHAWRRSAASEPLR